MLCRYSLMLKRAIQPPPPPPALLWLTVHISTYFSTSRLIQSLKRRLSDQLAQQQNLWHVDIGACWNLWRALQRYQLNINYIRLSSIFYNFCPTPRRWKDAVTFIYSNVCPFAPCIWTAIYWFRFSSKNFGSRSRHFFLAITLIYSLSAYPLYLTMHQ